jgi:hypothetical protein
MRLKFLVFILLLSLTFGAASAQDDVRDFYGLPPYTDNITLQYPLSVFEDAVARVTPASTDADVPGGLQPETIEIAFQRYTGERWEDTGAYLYIYPVVSFPTEDQPVTAALNEARSLFALDDTAFEESVEANGIPVVNVLTSSPLFQAQVERLTFQNGQGVRFLTVFAQDVAPIARHQLVYNFQGITDDGNYYVTAQIPVGTDVLPDEPESLSGAEYDQFAQGFEQYLSDITAALDGLSASNFEPDLSALDSMIETLNIPSPDAVFLTSETGGQINYNGLSFSYDPSLASRVEVTEVPPVEDPDNQMMFGSMPGYTQFDFINYPENSVYQWPRLLFVAIDQFPGSDTVSDQVLAEVQNFLSAGAPLSSGMTLNQINIPTYPPINAAQMFVVQPTYLDFASGSGVRFVTYYAQDASPITNQYLIYQFQGLSADGRYLVAGQFPVSTSILPDSFEVTPDFDYESFIESYETYMEETVAALDDVPEDEFVPPLPLLDSLVASIQTAG